MRMISGFLVGLALLASPATAAEKVYICAVKSGEEDGGWLSKEYAFAVDADTGAVAVSDPVVLYFNKGQPADGKLVAATDTKTVFTWSVLAHNSAGQRTRMSYRGVLFSEGAEFSVTGKPIGYSNSYSAWGNCQPG